MRVRANRVAALRCSPAPAPRPALARRCSTTTRRAGASSCCASRSRRQNAHRRAPGEDRAAGAGRPTTRCSNSPRRSSRCAATIAGMRGQIEVLANQAETADQRARSELYLDIDTRLRKLEKARERRRRLPEKPGARAETRAVARRRRKAYQAALDQFKLGNYSLAVAAMQGFLVTYPNSALAAERAVLDRHGALRAARLQERDRRAAQAARRLARQPEGARRDALHRQRAGDHGRPRQRAQDPGRADRQVPGEQLGDEREAAPRGVLQAR